MIYEKISAQNLNKILLLGTLIQLHRLPFIFSIRIGFLLASSLGWDGFPSVYRKLELEVEKLGYTVRWDSLILSISLPAPSCSVRQGSSKADRWKLLVRIISRRLARVGVGK